VFDLRVRCDRNPEGKDSTDPRIKYFDSNVYAGMIRFGPQQNQMEEFKDALPAVVNPDILLVKLRPGQVSVAPSLGDARTICRIAVQLALSSSCPRNAAVISRTS
jgi:DNA-directed RNA polymerase I and III subunit RPAC1